MDDPGGSNIYVGHRRWIIYPHSKVMGNGATTTTNALWVTAATDTDQPNPALVGWPTAGWFPPPLEPDGRLSICAGDDSTDFRDARVYVTRAGERLDVDVHPVALGYGSRLLPWSSAAPTGRARTASPCGGSISPVTTLSRTPTASGCSSRRDADALGPRRSLARETDIGA